MVFLKLVHTEYQVNHKTQPFWIKVVQLGFVISLVLRTYASVSKILSVKEDTENEKQSYGTILGSLYIFILMV